MTTTFDRLADGHGPACKTVNIVATCWKHVKEIQTDSQRYNMH